MRFTEKLAKKTKDIHCDSPLKIAFLGDSVTHGCFELKLDSKGGYISEMDYDAVYSNRLRQLFALTFPETPITIINAGVSGDNAPGGVKRVERDVVSCSPDLTVVCYGLNDMKEEKQVYLDSLAAIFKCLTDAGSEVIFMTPNMMCTYSDPCLPQAWYNPVNESLIPSQNGGKMDEYIYAAAEMAKRSGVTVCDCYSKWKRLAQLGCDTTGLLANYINHPNRDMHELFAVSLFETICGM